jgi:hypothetical protein
MSVKGQSWYLDDIPLGYTHACGSKTLSAEDIAVFKERFAPHLPLAQILLVPQHLPHHLLVLRQAPRRTLPPLILSSKPY